MNLSEIGEITEQEWLKTPGLCHDMNLIFLFRGNLAFTYPL